MNELGFKPTTISAQECTLPHRLQPPVLQLLCDIPFTVTLVLQCGGLHCAQTMSITQLPTTSAFHIVTKPERLPEPLDGPLGRAFQLFLLTDQSLHVVSSISQLLSHQLAG